ncbi:hypothetical protein COV82_05105 [Candidatus Peregrinibacteria bacterium CG11_big_fil_rev_8_21_14_0_20_46_8]|nr:MAG: hypothetical protein COV82_05105 [Candidatus Peregrinibacteria bacterium CG11_big_fil_rev_8_21_14_0_20_46_8]
MKKISLFILSLFILSACTNTEPGPSKDPEFDGDLAHVEKVEILVMESFPVQITAVAHGTLPDSCTTLHEPIWHYEEHRFSITLTTSRPPDAICAQVITPFTERIPLEVIGLRKGEYEVIVNGVKAEFELQTDNVPLDTESK